MNGLEKITSQILDDARREAEELLRKAEKQTEAIRSEADESVKQIRDDQAAKAKQQSDSYKERLKSSAQLKKRQAVLLAKQQVIAEMLKKVHQALLEKEPDEYFALLEKMAERFALAKDGEIYFSKRDLGRMPEGFAAYVQQAAKKKGGSLRLMEEPKEIDGGFILVYGGVEENCSFQALLSARKDELSDKVHGMLFA